MDAHNHWDNVYGKKAPDAVSWYRPHLEKSLELTAPSPAELTWNVPTLIIEVRL